MGDIDELGRLLTFHLPFAPNGLKGSRHSTDTLFAKIEDVSKLKNLLQNH